VETGFRDKIMLKMKIQLDWIAVWRFLRERKPAAARLRAV